MRKPVLVLVYGILAVALVLSAQQNDLPKKARIEGSVVSLTGEPIPRATIRLQGGQPLAQGAAVTPLQASTTTADDAGKFAIENIEPGRNRQLFAQRPGYVNAMYGARTPGAPGTPLTLDAGAELKGLVITMTPQGVITGRITDETGDAVQGAMVAVMRRGYQRGVRQLVPQSTATTNDQGEFRVANLPPGRYYISASDRRILDSALAGGAPGGGRLGNITTYYPNATDPQAAVALDVAPGAELRGIDIRFRTGRMYSIRGKVDLAGAPAGNVSVTAMPKNAAANIVAARTQVSVAARPPEYAFELRNVVEGSYTVQARMTLTANGVATPRLGGALDVTVADADVSGLVVLMGAGATITGTVTLEGGDLTTVMTSGTPGAARADAAVPVIVAADGGVLNLVTTGARPAVRLSTTFGAGTAVASNGPVGDDGKFTLEGVNPGKYQVGLLPLPQGMFLKSARFGGQDALRSGLEVTGGGTLEIVVSNKPAEITGVVRAEGQADSLAALRVTLWTKDAEPGTATNGIRSVVSDQNGGFRFQGLPPGEYLAAAWEEIDNGLLQSREFLAQFASEAGKATLQEGGRGAIEAKLIPVEKIKAAEAKLP